MKTRNILVFLFLIVLTLLNQTSYALGDSFCGGNTALVFSSPPRLGMITTLTLEHTPDIKLQGARAYVHMYFRFSNGDGFKGDDGFEVVGGNKGEDENAEKFEVEKTYKKSIQIKVKRTGLWNVIGVVYYNGFPTEKDPETAACAAVGGATLVVTEDDVKIYHHGEDIPKEAYTIPSVMDIQYFESKGKMEGKHFTAYLPKETRLDFEPTYQFKLSYGTSSTSFEADTTKLTGTPQWRADGNIGTVDNTGLFTATKFGKGKVCVKHSVLEDCIDVDVVPLPNPSPADKIVDVVVVPYETEEEKNNFGKVMAEYKGKKFKSKKEAHETLNPKGATKGKIKTEGYENEILEWPTDKITLKVGEKKTVLFKGLTADGKVVDIKGNRMSYVSEYDCLKKNIGNFYNDIDVFVATGPGSCAVDAALPGTNAAHYIMEIEVLAK